MEVNYGETTGGNVGAAVCGACMGCVDGEDNEWRCWSDGKRVWGGMR